MDPIPANPLGPTIIMPNWDEARVIEELNRLMTHSFKTISFLYNGTMIRLAATHSSAYYVAATSRSLISILGLMLLPRIKAQPTRSTDLRKEAD